MRDGRTDNVAIIFSPDFFLEHENKDNYNNIIIRYSLNV